MPITVRFALLAWNSFYSLGFPDGIPCGRALHKQLVLVSARVVFLSQEDGNSPIGQSLVCDHLPW